MCYTSDSVIQQKRRCQVPANKPFMIRLRPETRALLDMAATSQRRSRASIVDEAIKVFLEGRNRDLNHRLAALLEAPK